MDKNVKRTVYNTLNTKENNLEKEIPCVPTLIKASQYNTDKLNLVK